MPRHAHFVSFLFLTSVALAGCASCAERDDRFHTPEATVETLFRAYEIHDMSEAEVLARMEARHRFRPQDIETYQACFDDFRGGADEGLGGFVFGALAAGKDRLEYDVEGDRAVVRPAGGESARNPEVILRRKDGKWKIALRESVPEEIQQRLDALYQRSREQAARRGTPE